MPNPSSPLANRRILVVEDEYLIAVETKRWLTAAGATVIGPVPSVAQALDLIEDDGLNAALLDINLGGGDRVYPVAEKLNAIGVPYLFATGDVRTADALAYEHRPRIVKPYVEADVVQALAELVG